MYLFHNNSSCQNGCYTHSFTLKSFPNGLICMFGDLNPRFLVKGTVTRFCGNLISVPANSFSRLAFGEEILFHRH